MCEPSWRWRVRVEYFELQFSEILEAYEYGGFVHILVFKVQKMIEENRRKSAQSHLFSGRVAGAGDFSVHEFL